MLGSEDKDQIYIYIYIPHYSTISHILIHFLHWIYTSPKLAPSFICWLRFLSISTYKNVSSTRQSFCLLLEPQRLVPHLEHWRDSVNIYGINTRGICSLRRRDGGHPLGTLEGSGSTWVSFPSLKPFCESSEGPGSLVVQLQSQVCFLRSRWILIKEPNSLRSQTYLGLKPGSAIPFTSLNLSLE